jgi:hypothetical protein
LNGESTTHRNRFVLKGALLVTTWFDNPHRPTRDLDLLGYGDPSPEAMLAVFKEICSTELDDGIQFDTEQLRVTLIREELKYGGLRLSTTASIAGARIRVIVDIGFGDSVEPGVEEIDLPVLLDLAVPRLRAYARETVIARIPDSGGLRRDLTIVLKWLSDRYRDFPEIVRGLMMELPDAEGSVSPATKCL